MTGKACGAGGHDGAGQLQRVDLDVLAGLRSLDDLASAQVHDDVTRVLRGAVRARIEDKVSRLDLGQRNLRAVKPPSEGGAGNADPGRGVGGVDQAEQS